MPETPRLMKPSTSETCESRSSSRRGPRQTMLTPSSRAALTAPAWTLCQKTCEVLSGSQPRSLRRRCPGVRRSQMTRAEADRCHAGPLADGYCQTIHRPPIQSLIPNYPPT